MRLKDLSVSLSSLLLYLDNKNHFYKYGELFFHGEGLHCLNLDFRLVYGWTLVQHILHCHIQIWSATLPITTYRLPLGPVIT